MVRYTPYLKQQHNRQPPKRQHRKRQRIRQPQNRQHQLVQLTHQLIWMRFATRMELEHTPTQPTAPHLSNVPTGVVL